MKYRRLRVGFFAPIAVFYVFVSISVPVHAQDSASQPGTPADTMSIHLKGGLGLLWGKLSNTISINGSKQSITYPLSFAPTLSIEPYFRYKRLFQEAVLLAVPGYDTDKLKMSLGADDYYAYGDITKFVNINTGIGFLFNPMHTFSVAPVLGFFYCNSEWQAQGISYQEESLSPTVGAKLSYKPNSLMVLDFGLSYYPFVFLETFDKRSFGNFYTKSYGMGFSVDVSFTKRLKSLPALGFSAGLKYEFIGTFKSKQAVDAGGEYLWLKDAAQQSINSLFGFKATIGYYFN